MGNFTYLQSLALFEAFAPACIEAEAVMAVSPALCVLGCRKGAELAVGWLYAAYGIKQQSKDTFGTLIQNKSFIACLDNNLIQEKLAFILNIGNKAAHTGSGCTRQQAVVTLKNLFDVVQFIGYCYVENYIEHAFDETLLPPENAAGVSRAELERLRASMDAREDERNALINQISAAQEELDALKAANAAARTAPPRQAATEAETRRTLIDVDIQSAGWIIGDNCLLEYRLNTGEYADYVLFGDNGKPLAVVEAKRTTRDPQAGKQQAKDYADALEKTTSQRPLIFCTNGYETWFWDDAFYPSRKVFGVFAKADCERLVNRRSMRVPLDNGMLYINENITDRHYQKIAVQRACAEFGQGRRHALLVMATGTGKTRTVVSLFDVLQRHNWAVNILFLADRRKLVKQAKRAFNKSLPNLSACSLLDHGADGSPTDRAVFSTYPTIMNAIDSQRNLDGTRLFTSAHFDVIVVDEAHRSIFKKYRAIFDYFDALVIGLTATPKADIDRNTYSFFHLEDHMPTYAYEYDTAVRDGYLCDYHCIEKLFKIPLDGIKKHELTPEEREALDDQFDEEGEAPDYIPPDQIDRVFFNIDTCRRVLSDLMEKGIKVEGGDKLGKTLIFARNHRHARFIEEQFNALYPQYRGMFARVIDNQEERAEELMDAFEDPGKCPQIAISVDMMDTGVDVPDIVNLVFFKRVLSKVKFWQMIGRGTRLRQNLFGFGKDKKEFFIFDYLGNFDYFRENPKGMEAQAGESLSSTIFALKARIVQSLQAARFQDEECQDFRAMLVDNLAASVAALNRVQFMVKQNLREVERYSGTAAYAALSVADTEAMIDSLSGLVLAEDNEDNDEMARRFDVVLYNLMYARAAGDERMRRKQEKKVTRIAAALEEKTNLPDVAAALPMIRRIQGEGFWEATSFQDLEAIRQTIRRLVLYLRMEFFEKVINVTDEVLLEREGERLGEDEALESYRRRAQRYIDENSAKASIRKLKNNEPLNASDWRELERIFWHDVGTQAEYFREVRDEKLGRFVRSLTGLSQEAVTAAFSEFLNSALYSEPQIQMVCCIVNWLRVHGTLPVERMQRSEFFGGLILSDEWGNYEGVEKWSRVLNTISSVNQNAERAVA
jgi:type I restriction enzyme R subunit